jgi:hypothetical protein
MLDTANGMNREMVPLYGAYDQNAAGFLTERCLDAIGAAVTDARKTSEGGQAGGNTARIRMSRGSVKGLATNRHDPAALCDDGLFLVEFLRADGKKILIYNLCCHPTVLNAHNRLISADFPGAVADLLESDGNNSGAYDMVFFVNGSAGDMSTRFTRKESSFDECKRFGALVQKAITETAGRDGEFEALEEARLEYRRIELKRAEVPAPEAAEQRLAEMRKNLDETKKSTADPKLIRKAESFVEGAEISLLKARYPRRGDDVSVETGLLTLNGQKILCVPLELFSSLALPLKRRRNVEFFGYANALLGYLADREAYNAMDYEALFSEFAKGEGEHYIEQLSGYC